jgi:hypothetical protein
VPPDTFGRARFLFHLTHATQPPMMHIRFKQTFALSLAIAACVACAPSNGSDARSAAEKTSAAGKTNDTAVKAPLQDTIKALLAESAAGGFNLGSQLRFPALSVYSADGRLIGRIDSEESLATFDETLSKAAAGGASMPGKHLPLETLDRVVKKFHKGQTGLSQSNGMPTLVYWRPDFGCEDSCPKFESALEKSQREDKKGFNLVRITLTR